MMLGFSLRLLRHDWRAGELRVLMVALLIAVASMTSVAFFTDRIGQALRHQGSELLGADLRLLSDVPITPQVHELVTAAGLETVETRAFRSMVVAGEQMQLAELKAVAQGYPLRGALRIADTAFGADQAAGGIPPRGEAWADPRLMQLLQLTVGDSVRVGDATLRVSAMLRFEPDRSGDMFSIAPRLLMNLADLPDTGLIQEGSRISYGLLLAGTPDTIDATRDAIDKLLGQGDRLESVSEARQEVRTALTRARQFLGLAAVVGVVLACVAIAMAARRYARRHLDTCAILRCLGTRQAQINRIFLIQLLALGLIASVLGVLLGYAAQLALSQLLGQLVLVTLPPPSWAPVGLGLGVALISLLGFALPPVLQLRDVPTLQVLRRELAARARGDRWLLWSGYGLGALALGGLLYIQAGDPRMGRLLVLGLLGTGVVLWLVAVLLIKVLGRLSADGTTAWHYGLKNLGRHGHGAVVQVMAFGLGLMVLLLLTVVRSDLLQGWRDSLPADAPNRFVVNIQDNQRDAVAAFFAARGMASTELYPMIRARLHAINDTRVDAQEFGNDRANHLARRMFNLSWARDMAPDNTLVAGQWWGEGEVPPQFSVEAGIAENLGIRLGDRLSFEIAGEMVVAPVTSLRQVQWDNLRANFFVTAAPGTLDGYPSSYITSFYLAEGDAALLNDLIREFPNLTVIDVAAIMAQIRQVIERVALAVEYVFLFTLAAGLAVMYAAIASTLDERLHENAILRALGAPRRRLWTGLMTEFATLGGLAGLLAALMATALGYGVARYALELTYAGNGWIWIAGILGGGLGIGLAGILGTRAVVNSPPLRVLRDV